MLKLLIVALIPLGFGVTWVFLGEVKSTVPTTSLAFLKTFSLSIGGYDRGKLKYSS